MSSIITSLDRGLELILLLYGNGKEMGVTEIAKELNVYKSTVHRTLITLQEKDFVRQNPSTGKYWLGPIFYTIGLKVSERYSLGDVVGPIADELHAQVGEVINVSVLHFDQRNGYQSIIVYKSQNSNNVLSITPSLGSSMDAHVSGVGKCLLAWNGQLDNDYLRNKKYQIYTKNTIDNYDDLMLELERVRQQGYAIDNEEREIGLFCIAAPIFNSSGEVVAAISISGPRDRMLGSDELDKKLEYLQASAKKISQQALSFKH